MHARGMYVCEVHVHEVYPHEMHAHKMHARKVHTHETSTHPLLWWLSGLNSGRFMYRHLSFKKRVFALVAGGPYCPPHPPHTAADPTTPCCNSSYNGL